MKKLALRCFTALFGILFIAVSIELAFEARHSIESVSENRAVDSRSAKKHVLFVADSILGFLPEPNSPAHATAKFLGSDHYVFEELSAPAIETDRIVELLPDTILQFAPDVVVIMVGKSDTPHLIKDRSYDRWFRTLRLYRLGFVVYLDLVQKLSRFRTQYFAADGPITDIRKAWIFFGQKNCQESLPYFERALTTGASNERNLKGLALCYRNAHEIPRGIEFLGRLKTPGADASLVRLLVQSLSVDLNRSSSEKNKMIDVFLAQDTPLRESRDLLRTKLWLYQTKQDSARFAELFKMINAGSTDPLPETTQNNLRRIFKEILETRARIVLVQYPLDDVGYLKQIFSDLDRSIEFVNSRDWFSNYTPRERMLNLWAEDIEHLTPLGSEVLGRNLADVISHLPK